MKKEYDTATLLPCAHILISGNTKTEHWIINNSLKTKIKQNTTTTKTNNKNEQTDQVEDSICPHGLC